MTEEQVRALEAQADEHPGLTLLEHVELFEAEHGVSLAFSTVKPYFKRLGITHKKRASTPANETN